MTSYVLKFGANTDVDAATAAEDITDAGGTYPGHPTSGVAETATVTSDNAADAPGGIGARVLRIEGLDADWLEQREDLTLAGLTPVTGTAVWQRIFRARVIDSGTAANNEGTLTVTHSATTANVFTAIAPGRGQSNVCAYTVPANRSGSIRSWRAGVSNSASTAQEAELAIVVRTYGTGTWRVLNEQWVSTSQSAAQVFGSPINLGPQDDVKVRALAATANNLSVTAELDIDLHPV